MIDKQANNKNDSSSEQQYSDFGVKQQKNTDGVLLLNRPPAYATLFINKKYILGCACNSLSCCGSCLESCFSKAVSNLSG